MKALSGFSVILLVLFFARTPTFAAQQQAFDEVTGSPKTKPAKKAQQKKEATEVRPAYRGVIEIYRRLSAQQREHIREKSLRHFQGDNELFPLPRVLTTEEFQSLREGVEQRSEAILKFLVDHYSGEKNYLKDGIIPFEVIERILTRSGEKGWEGKLNPEHIRFWYGPDLIRGPATKKYPEGRFFVVEDNPGFLGGMGDLKRARESLYKNIPDYRDAFESPDPSRFYQRLATEYKKRAASYGGIPVVLMYTHSLAADNEDKRVERIFQELGIEVVRLNPLFPNVNYRKKLIVKNRQVYLEIRSDSSTIRRRKVGYVVANMDPIDLEPMHEANRQNRVLLEAESQLEDKRLGKKHRQTIEQLMSAAVSGKKTDIETLAEYISKKSNIESWLSRKAGISGILDAYSEGRVGLTNGPGTEFIGDKGFYIYVEKLIRYYLGEEPILRNIKTESFVEYDKNGKSRIKEKLLEKVYRQIKKYVVKAVDGRGGDGVWVGPNITADERKASRQKVIARPEGFIVQDFTALSRLEGQIGDIRLHSEVSAKESPIVADVPWARVVNAKGNGKVNLSAQGAEATVLIRDVSPLRCQSAIFSLLGL